MDVVAQSPRPVAPMIARAVSQGSATTEVATADRFIGYGDFGAASSPVFASAVRDIPSGEWCRAKQQLPPSSS